MSLGKTINIHEDVWTCSDEMRAHIADFFKENTHFKLAEIGAYKGYSTRILSQIFAKVYAVDNSVEWTNLSKEFNKNRTNIEYVMLDIYKESWGGLPTDIDVVFIDADHNFNSCKSDVFNSMRQFSALKYIIFDDYGVWPGVRNVVDTLIKNKLLKFERFIGITDVPGLDGIVRDTHEGIICSVVKNSTLNDKTYTWLEFTITFLENGMMNAFGHGYYTPVDTHTFMAYFGGREHTLVFNSDYTEFVSTRSDDGNKITGRLCTLPLTP
jgi:hypothetical protein